MQRCRRRQMQAAKPPRSGSSCGATSRWSACLWTSWVQGAKAQPNESNALQSRAALSDFPCTTVYFNNNVEAALRCESNNKGPSLFAEFGNFEAAPAEEEDAEEGKCDRWRLRVAFPHRTRWRQGGKARALGSACSWGTSSGFPQH